MTTGAAASASTVEGSGQQYDWLREDDAMVPMRDGVHLATDVYRPASDGRPLPGPFPALLERTPYDKRGPHAAGNWLVASAKFFARRGYVVALQDVRGRF